MGPVAQVVLPGVVLAAAGALGVLLVAGVAALRAARAGPRAVARLDAELARSRVEVEALSRRVDELADEVVQARRAAELDREYVITSLARRRLSRVAGPGGRAAGRSTARTAAGRPGRSRTSSSDALARQPRARRCARGPSSSWSGRSSLGHGVRRALSPDVLDRAAAEAHVARRRSRRERRRELREAAAAGPRRRPADAAGPRLTGRREDAA